MTLMANLNVHPITKISIPNLSLVIIYIYTLFIKR